MKGGLLRRVRRNAAGWLLDAPRYGLPLHAPRLARRLGRSWIDLHNRGERLVRDVEQRGVRCDWPWTSHLYYCECEPEVGRQLMRVALEEWPVAFRDEASATSEPPLVSFVIGHRGLDRLPQLLATIGSIAAQVEIGVECIVVEQAAAAELPGRLPRWVRLVHTPVPPGMPYSRAWAFNVGAREARGRYLVLHDNDLCVPNRYAAELVNIFRRGYEVARIQRFLFYLDEASSQGVYARREIPLDRPPLLVVQNTEGGTLAVERQTYAELGGHDEGFVGWGGEDNEMFDRCRTRKIHDHAYLPLVHLHHAAQPRNDASRTAYFEARLKIPAEERIRRLTARGFGHPEGPTGGGTVGSAGAGQASSLTTIPSGGPD
jgi:hypothetical protein